MHPKDTTKKKAVLLLEDGSSFEGNAIGKIGSSGGEICFNTSMAGYQEVYTDPSYFGQIIINTTAHIGNYGTISSEQESEKPQINGLVVNEFSSYASRKTADDTLQHYLEKNNIVGISNLDTRKLVRHIREKGAMNAVISSESTEMKDLQKLLKKVPSMNGLELASKVSTSTPYIEGKEGKFKIAVLDIGIKKSILSNFIKRNCICKVFPAHTSFKDMQAWNPDGYFISNGPGDPASMGYAVKTVKDIIDAGRALFGICLGHQLLALAMGIKTYKMNHGHRGANHPVKNLLTGKGEITSQNHGFVVDENDLKQRDDIEITHINLNDSTVEGLRLKNKKVFSVQYHPESSPGPHDSQYLFDDFLNLLDKN